MPDTTTPHGHRPSYTALVAALRGEFQPFQLEALWLQLREHRYNTGSLGVLAQAVHDAHDVTYGTGEPARAAIEPWMGRRADPAITDHAFTDGYSGMSCVEMVLLPDSSGDQCGRPAAEHAGPSNEDTCHD